MALLPNFDQEMRMRRISIVTGRWVCGGIIAGAILAAGSANKAEAEDLKIRSPIIEAGEIEFEHNFVFGRGKTTVHEIEYGLTDWFKPGIEVEFAADPGQGLHYDAAALEGFFQLTPQGKYWADLGIFVEYEHTGRTGDPRSVKIGPMIQKEIQLPGLSMLNTANLFFTKEMGASSVGTPGMFVAAQSRFRLDPHFEPGIEYYGIFTLGEHGEEPQHRLGPAVAGRVGFREFGLEAPGGIKYDAAYLRRIAGETDPSTFRVRFELEFPL
jgi:hypothetical protein